jgi:molybdopterin-binding protein
MKISARNVLKGKVVDVRKDAVAAQVQVDIGGGNLVTATITADSANRLQLEVDKEVAVIIKASDVMIGVD